MTRQSRGRPIIGIPSVKKLMSLFLANGLIVLHELAENMHTPAILRLLEGTICQKHYASLDPNQISVPESLCKIDMVQIKPAYTNGLYCILCSPVSQASILLPVLKPQ